MRELLFQRGKNLKNSWQKIACKCEVNVNRKDGGALKEIEDGAKSDENSINQMANIILQFYDYYLCHVFFSLSRYFYFHGTNVSTRYLFNRRHTKYNTEEK